MKMFLEIENLYPFFLKYIIKMGIQIGIQTEPTMIRTKSKLKFVNI